MKGFAKVSQKGGEPKANNKRKGDNNIRRTRGMRWLKYSKYWKEDKIKRELKTARRCQGNERKRLKDEEIIFNLNLKIIFSNE
jgi:hypothetical protein